MTETNRVWMPDTFFQNEKLGHFHNIIVPNVYVRIFPSGRVLYSIRLIHMAQISQVFSKLYYISFYNIILIILDKTIFFNFTEYP